MCGRVVAASPPSEIARYFDVDDIDVSIDGAENTGRYEPRYNVAPTSDLFVIRSDGSTRRLDRFHWGLVPSWAKDISVGNRMINARAETVAEKPAFRKLFAERRCIIPVDGFYEWRAVPAQRRKQPYYIHRADGEMFAFAGLWTTWRGPDAASGVDPSRREGGGSGVLRSTTIITGPPNDKMAQIHDRMPVMLAPGSWEEWLDPAQQDVTALGRLLVPAPSELITFHPVSTEVNNARNQGAHLLDEAPPDEQSAAGS